MDVHFPHLTVDQTLKFAIACKTPNIRPKNVSRNQYINAYRDILATVFGLMHALNTKVGNDFVRGVSGGERKRVSIAEALSARASVYLWDNETRGLDASTALEFTRAVRSSTNLLNNVAVIAAYQAGENIYESFDKVCVLYSGRQVFWGPITRAREYFEEMGFECLHRQCTAEFLTAVTDPNGRFPKKGMENAVPKTVEEFVDYWTKSTDYKIMLNEINDYDNHYNHEETYQTFKESTLQEKMKTARSKSQYTISFFEQLKLLIKRSFQRKLGDKAFTIIDCVASIIQALIFGSLFYNISDSTSGAYSRGGVLNFSILLFAIIALAEISYSFEHRPILLKQKSYMFYHPAGEQLARSLSDIPFKLVSITGFTIIIYFLTNLKRTAGQFFIFFIFVCLTSFTMNALFQMVASSFQTMAPANSVSGIGVLATVVYTGYILQQGNMRPWFKWIRFLNPLFYSFEALMANEFHGREMSCGAGTLVPSGPGYGNGTSSDGSQVCAVIGANTGSTVVSGDRYIELSYDYKFSHVWRNFGIVIAYWILFLVVAMIFTEFLKPASGGGDKLMFKRGCIPDEFKKKLDNNDKEKGEESAAGTNEIVVEKKIASTKELSNVFEENNTQSTEVFSWQNVDYVIPVKDGERKLLDNIQGYVKPGTITALMGESGAGKTTLLNVLSQRIDFGVITGGMLVDGKPIDNSFQRRTGYVQQQDLHVHEATVRESLIFSARLRQSSSVPDSEKLEYVEKIIDLLGMNLYADAIVGEPGVGLNVEQRKKLSIGVELVAKPSLLLFLDEPTSGLDSQSAWAIVLFLRELANAGQAILCTIHQPSATLFEQFDRLLLLKKGGKTVYFGDIGYHSNTLLDYFERNGAPKCQENENPAEYILECIGAGATAHVTEDWSDIWNNSDEFKATTREIEELHDELEKIEKPHLDDKSLGNRFATSWFTQLIIVTKRTYLQFWRDTVYVTSKLMLCIFGGLFLGFSFWDIDNTLAGNQNTSFVILMSLILSAPLMNQIHQRALASRELYEIRESASNTFHWSTLLLAQILAEIPYNFLGTSLIFCCLYFPLRVSFETNITGYYYLIYAIIFQLYFTTFGLLTIYIAPDLPSASVITSLLFNFMISFCGVFQYYSYMPSFWHFMYRVSPYTYFVQSLVGDLLHDFKIDCSTKELAYFDPPNGGTCLEYAGAYVEQAKGKLINPEATQNCAYCRYSVGDDFLSFVNISFSQRWRNFGLGWVYIIFNIFAMLGLYWLLRVPKKKFKFKKS